MRLAPLKGKLSRIRIAGNVFAPRCTVSCCFAYKIPCFRITLRNTQYLIFHAFKFLIHKHLGDLDSKVRILLLHVIPLLCVLHAALCQDVHRGRLQVGQVAQVRGDQKLDARARLERGQHLKN
jgi:hypothetical protein